MSLEKDKNKFSVNRPGQRDKDGKNSPDGKDPFTWKGPVKSLGFWVVIILISIFAYSLYTSSSKDFAEITYTEFLQQVENDNVISVTFIDRSIEGRLKSETDSTA